jgi:hypothetical protein
MTYHLFIDDERDLDFPEVIRSGIDSSQDWVVARSTMEAIAVVQAQGMPASLALDHDLGMTSQGKKDKIMDFLKWLSDNYPDGPVPKYTIHTANPTGYVNIHSFLDSWERSLS